MGAIVIRTRYDEGTESAEVATSEQLDHVNSDKSSCVFLLDNVLKGDNSFFRCFSLIICCVRLTRLIRLLEHRTSYFNLKTHVTDLITRMHTLDLLHIC